MIRYYFTPVRMTFKKQPVVPGLGKDRNHWNSHIILVGIQNGTAILKRA